MRRLLISGLGLLLFTACGADTVLWLRIEAPLVVPDDCNSVTVQVSRPDGTSAFSKAYDLGQGPEFPLTLSLAAASGSDVGVPLTVSVQALKSSKLARSWASKTASATLVKGQLTAVTVKLCGACP